MHCRWIKHECIALITSGLPPGWPDDRESEDERESRWNRVRASEDACVEQQKLLFRAPGFWRTAKGREIVRRAYHWDIVWHAERLKVARDKERIARDKVEAQVRETERKKELAKREAILEYEEAKRNCFGLFDSEHARRLFQILSNRYNRNPWLHFSVDEWAGILRNAGGYKRGTNQKLTYRQLRAYAVVRKELHRRKHEATIEVQ